MNKKRIKVISEGDLFVFVMIPRLLGHIALPSLLLASGHSHSQVVCMHPVIAPEVLVTSWLALVNMSCKSCLLEKFNGRPCWKCHLPLRHHDEHHMFLGLALISLNFLLLGLVSQLYINVITLLCYTCFVKVLLFVEFCLLIYFMVSAGNTTKNKTAIIRILANGEIKTCV